MTASNNQAIKFTATGLKEGDKLNAGSSAILTVKVEYLTGVEVDNKNLSANLTVTLDYVQANVGEGGIATVPGSDTLIENVVTEGDGLYEDPTEAGRYVYRGTDPNNYITFNGEEAGWRIISIENDGTMKIMKMDSLGNIRFDTEKVRYQGSTGYCNVNSSDRGCKVWGSNKTMLNSSGNNITTMPREINATAYTLPSKEASINIKPRLRMTTLYGIAQTLGYLVIGTGNICESIVGYTTKWGDNSSDFNPIGNFTVDEVLEIGKILGVPDNILNKAPNDGLSDITDEDKMGIKYSQVAEMIETGNTEEKAKQEILRRYYNSRNKRSLVPVYTFKRRNFFNGIDVKF